MRIGLSSPVLADSGPRPPGEAEAGVAELRTVFTTADRLGYEFFTCPEHVSVSPGLARGERFYDPVATFSYLAAITERIRFLPYVLVLGLHHPLELAKRYGTLDHLSGGRVVLGVGVGNLEEEFALLGRPFADRGPRADDALRALRASLSVRLATYHGEYYHFTEQVISPHAVQQKVPIWVGGHSRRALRRAVTLGDGWAPAPVTYRGPDLETLPRMLAEHDLPEGFDVVITPPARLDPTGAPEAALDLVGRIGEAGATVVNLVVRHRDLAEYLDQLAAAAELFDLDRRD